MLTVYLSGIVNLKLQQHTILRNIIRNMVLNPAAVLKNRKGIRERTAPLHVPQGLAAAS